MRGEVSGEDESDGNSTVGDESEAGEGEDDSADDSSRATRHMRQETSTIL